MTAAGDGATVEALLRAGLRLLADSGSPSDSPRLDAELLLAHALGWNRAALFARRESAVSGTQSDSFFAAIRVRQTGRPVAQILGRREFWTLDLRVTADVLTPRPDTEWLVERALAHLPVDSPADILDLGTGSGAVALAIASERSRCSLTATDLSAAALAVARDNAAALGLSRVELLAGDWFDAVGDRCFDLIVSNPPYIGDDEWQHSDRELAFEPRLALAAGADGLDALRRIIASALAHLRSGGWLLLEHGFAQGAAVGSLMQSAGFQSMMTSTDLAGHPRVTEGQRI